MESRLVYQALCIKLVYTHLASCSACISICWNSFWLEIPTQMVCKSSGRNELKAHSVKLCDPGCISLKVGSGRTPRAKKSPPLLFTMKNPNLNVSKNSRQHNGKAHRVLQWHAALHCKLEYPEKLTLGMQGKPLLLLCLQHSSRCYFCSFMKSM